MFSSNRKFFTCFLLITGSCLGVFFLLRPPLQSPEKTISLSDKIPEFTSCVSEEAKTNASSPILEFYSQCGQDKYVYENIFKNKKNGVFIDIGANDGITYSNTYFFEKFMNWTGICIEPIPDVFNRLKANRTSHCVQGCICDKYDNISFLKINGYAEMLSGIIENYDPRHIRRIEQEIAERGGQAEVISVKCYPLTQLLVDKGIFHVDYLSLDVEGGELDILKSIDFNLIKIDVIDVENNYGTSQFQEFLEPFGYKKVCTLDQDEIYQKVL